MRVWIRNYRRVPTKTRNHLLWRKKVSAVYDMQICYQIYKWEHTCHGTPHCRMAGSPRPKYIANCSVPSEIICLSC
uniref:Uncharacterized protein n=1 Tax=Strigamia maritima TaxID=126957 RepID=T1IUE1_STRMM